MFYLDKEQVLLINHLTFLDHGGTYNPPNNLLHEENLDYLLEAVESEMFGEPLYPTIADKAAIYLYNIVCNHVFHDGNKRTGLQVGLTFLKHNGYKISDSISPFALAHYVLDVASGNVTLDECRAWFAENIVAV
jgi:death-on-curing protein